MKDITASYRIYSKDRKRYIDYRKYSGDELVYLTQDGELLDSHNDVIENVIIEQCTGLKDKHENLIYEGDLVNLDGYGVCEVIWSEDTAEFMFKNLNEDLREHVDTMLMYDWEVVGNIHENSEFMEQIK